MTTTITPQQRLTVVKHLASGKPLDIVATITKIPRDEVLDIGSHHGYPDTTKLSWAADILEKKLQDEQTAEIPQAAATPLRQTVTQHGPTTTTNVPVPPAKPDEFRILINTAKSSDSKRIQNLADKILDDTAKLRGLIDQERVKHAKLEAKAAAARKIREEIKALEQQLAEAKAKARKTTGRAPRLSKGDHPCQHCDRVFDTAQGVSLHTRRTHQAA